MRRFRFLRYLGVVRLMGFTKRNRGIVVLHK